MSIPKALKTKAAEWTFVILFIIVLHYLSSLPLQTSVKIATTAVVGIVGLGAYFLLFKDLYRGRILKTAIALSMGAMLTFYCLRALSHPHFQYPIADADRVVITEDGSPESVTITGEKLDKIIRTVTSAKSDATKYAAKFSWKASFYRGTNRLGEVMICCDGLFLANGKQYHANSLLDDLVVTPFKQAQRFR